MKGLTKEVEFYVEKWTDILNLRDWRIRVVIEEKELPDGGMHEAACVYHCYEHHEAVIHILHPDNFHRINSYWNESQMESIIVHELIHLHFSECLSRSQSKLLRAELGINQLTNAFLTLDERVSGHEKEA